jgi:hypothetical protein
MIEKWMELGNVVKHQMTEIAPNGQTTMKMKMMMQLMMVGQHVMTRWDAWTQ